jgi:hypothetical protein
MSKKDETSLIVLDDKNPLDLFLIDSSLDDILKKVRDKTSGFVPDTSTAKGRDEIKALAYKVTRSKTLLDKAGKALVDVEREKTKDIDARIAKINISRRRAVAYLDALQGEVRGPLNDYEAEQVKIKEAAELRERISVDHEEAIRMNDLVNQEKMLATEREELRVTRERLTIEERAQDIARTATITAVKDIITRPPEQAPVLQPNFPKFGPEINKKFVHSCIIEHLGELGLDSRSSAKIVLEIIRGKIPYLTINYLQVNV